MEELKKELLQKEEELKALLENLESNKTPDVEGRLRITHKRGKPVYYLDLDIDIEKKGKGDLKEKPKRRSEYIRKSDMDKIIHLAQHDYEEKLRCEINKQLKILKAIIRAGKNYDEKALEKVYSKMHPCRKELIKPIVPDSETFVKQWLQEPFIRKQMSDYDQEIFTERGELVRSKSEKIIADKYLKLGVPYRYECQLALKQNGRRVIIYPDFTVLNKQTRKVYYHEHFGMMDSEEYSRSAMKRIELYVQNGIFVGEQLIVTHETSDRALNMQYFEQLVKKYLLD